VRYTGMNTKSLYVIATWQAVVIMVFCTHSLAADEGFRFFYNFAPGVTFYEMDHSRQESGSKLISEFRRTIEFRVSQAHGAALPTLSARIIELSNKGRRIDYYNGVQFEANISATGEVTENRIFFFRRIAALSTAHPGSRGGQPQQYLLDAAFSR